MCRIRFVNYKILLPAFVILFACVCQHCFADAVWQYSVPAPSISYRTAQLWIPPNCKRIRGVVVACQNMLERSLFERPAFRDAAASDSLAILLIDSGHDQAPTDGRDPNHPKRSSLDIFLNPNYPQGEEDPVGAGQDLQTILDELADKSGYSELKNAPLMPVGHSSAGSFVWHLYRWDPSRIFAMLPFKTGAKDDGPAGIPVMMVESEWFDYGNSMNDVWSRGSAQGRGAHGQCLFGYYVDIGSGHCDVTDESIKAVALFMKKAVDARIPSNAPLDGQVVLKPISAESGWLLDSAAFGRPENTPVMYKDYKGDPAKAYWYVDKELATYCQNHTEVELAKKPQQINFYPDGGAPLPKGGTYSFSPTFLSDGETFKVQASYIDTLTGSDLYPPGTMLGNSEMPINYRVTSGALVQVGPDTFKIRLHVGPIIPQGNPWEPTLVAYTLGNAEYRPTERPAHVNISIVNTQGAPQNIIFHSVPDQKTSSKSPIPLLAKASSGLPVEYFMVSGPAEIAADGKSLVLTQIPVRSKYPIQVTVGAFQWGRSIDPKIQSADRVYQEFSIIK